MRELKFRCFDKQTKQMSPPFTLFGEFLLIGAVHTWQRECGNDIKDSLDALKDLEVMQSIGLLDKKGKEIFEGDIIKYDLAKGLGQPEKKNLKEVVKISAYGAVSIYYQNINVIGNIYENPELLKNDLQ